MRRVAVVDLGTNSTRLLVADVEDGRVDEVVRRLRITRLGEGVDARRRLLPLPIARVRNVLTDFRREAEALGAEVTLAVATSAVRDAENGEAFLGEIEWSYGFVTQLLSGEEEAALAFRGTSENGRRELGTLLVDVGGGSTELSLDGAFLASVPAGCVRHTELFLRSDPPTSGELDAAARAVRTLVGDVRADGVVRALGVAGTATTLAALDLGLKAYDPKRIHGHVVTHTGLDLQLERLAALPLEKRRRVAGLEPERAPVIVAGLVVLREVLDRFELDAVEASERDLLHGAALTAAELPVRAEGDAPPGAYTCC